MSFLLGTALLAVVTAVACAVPGVFIVLRRGSMLIDAMSHAVFPGIVLGYALTHDLTSPLLLLTATLASLAIVLGAQWLTRTGLISGDAPQGLIHPALFSLGVILVSHDFAHVHLDTHAVLVGDLNLAAWEPLEIAGHHLGPRYLFIMAGIALLMITFIALAYRPLTIATFDPNFALTQGIPVRRLTRAFMFLVALIVTASFHAAGAILVVALVVAPAATSLLLSTRLIHTLALSVGIAALGAAAGFAIAYHLDAATSAAMTVLYGLLFLAVLLFTYIRRRRAAHLPGSLAP